MAMGYGRSILFCARKWSGSADQPDALPYDGFADSQEAVL